MPRLTLISYMFVCFFMLQGIPSAAAQTVSIAWDASPEPDVTGYKLYYGNSSRSYHSIITIGNRTEYTFGDLTGMEIVYVAVTAVDMAGNESDYSEELALEMKKVAALFRLGDAYPNPFNPDTRIPYYLPSDMQIDLRVYDLLGRQVAVLEKGPRPAGAYVSVWDGKDGAGRPVANGPYFIRLRVGDFSMGKRVLLLK